MNKRILQFLLLVITLPSQAYSQVALDNFVVSPYFDEQVLAYDYGTTGVKIEVNAPSIADFDAAKPTAIVMYGLPNGNTIDWTIGKKAATGDDWHYQIQHIGAQTRFVRNQNPDFNLVTVYFEPSHSGTINWVTWKGSHIDWAQIVKNATDEIVSLFSAYNPYVVLSGHSGGGNLPFGYLEAVTEIPSYVKRISFLDSNYNWEASSFGKKITNWLKESPDNKLSVIAYNDSVALLNGAPIVSATGGTWYRSRVMHKYLKEQLPDLEWIESEYDGIIKYNTSDNQIQFLLKENPSKAILHTVLVEKNGFIQSLFSGTDLEAKGYTFYGNHAYDNLVQSAIVYPHILRIPPRKSDAIGGAAFMEKIKNLSLSDRESEIYKEISRGNIPNSHRQTKLIKETLVDASEANHEVEYLVMPDFLAIGSDDDFCRVPMLPETAQRVANLFGATLPTSKLSDLNYKNADIKLSPKTMTPDATMTTVPVFLAHNQHIEDVRKPLEKPLSSLMMGHKKDIVISNQLATKPDAVAIYGWHQANGIPIQSIYTGHSRDYVDYSHGARMINQEIMIDGKNTKVRTILRDAVKYKILSDETGVMSTTEYTVSGLPQPPKRPTSFAVISHERYCEVRIKTEASLRYKVHYGTDISNLDNNFEYNVDRENIINRLEEEIIYIAIEAENAAGASPRSELLTSFWAARPTCGSPYRPPALVVNGFDRVITGNTYDFVKEHLEATAYYRRFDVSSATNDAVIDGLVDLKDYTFVDYILGEESTADNTFNATEQSLVKSYLEKGGGLLMVSGAEIGWDLGRAASATSSKQFMENYLKCTFVEDSPEGSAGAGLYHSAETTIDFENLPKAFNFNFGTGTRGTSVRFPDVLKPASGAIGFLQYKKNGVLYDTNKGYAGIIYKGTFGSGTTQGGVIVMGIPLETIDNEEHRGRLVQEIINYSLPPSSIEIVDSDGFELSQNHPNPAKYESKISYRIPQAAHVRLAIWSTTGQLQKILVDEAQGAGEHILSVNLEDIGAGIYFYQLSVDGFKQSRKMIVAE